MKIAITCTGEKLDSVLDKRFGRCAYFALYDTLSKETVFVENTAKNAEEGAGPAAVQLIASYGVEKIISGEFGFKIKALLSDLKIQMIMLKEEQSVKEILGLLEQKV